MTSLRITLFVFISCFILSQSIQAQNKINWNNRPHKGFVFEITNDEAQKLLTKWSYRDSISSLLHTQIDTFDVRQGWHNKPNKGHFILVSVVANKMHCEYKCVFPYQVFLFKEYGALSLQVLDHNGDIRNDAIVKLKRKRIRADHESKTYRIENAYFRGDNRLATVELDGFRSVFSITKHKVPHWENNYNYDDGPDFYSYLITDKNKYKPNEKVRFKSYAVNSNRWPLRKELEVWMYTSKGYKRISTIEPHRPGSYAGEFELHDSLGLKLDRSYTINLRNKQGRVIAGCQFYYEDYELFGNEVEIKLATEQHYKDQNNELTITATDENGLMLKDAHALVTVTTKGILKSYQPMVVLKDTLIYKKILLNPAAPTKFRIPSSLFQKTNTNYQVHVAVLNSENERHDRYASATHYYSQYQILSHFEKDSICFNLYDNGVLLNDVNCILKSNLDREFRDMKLPFKEKINPAIKSYNLKTDLAKEQISVGHLPLSLEITGGIKNDSFNIELVNEQKLDVSWYVYQGSRLLHKGYDTALAYKSLIEDRTLNYYVELFFTIGGQERMIRRHYSFRESDLNIDFDIPERVYPGQTVAATITVTNSQGRPVKGVDLTALATTSKLDYYLPDLPYYGDISKPRSKSDYYSQKKISNKYITIDLPYTEWSEKLRLDTMMYYQFTYPGPKPFRYKYSIDDSTQIAPYIMQNGIAQKIFIVELNRKPVYYSWTESPEQYSFYISPKKKYELALRLSDRLIIMDSIQCDPGTKTIISLNLDSLPSNTKVIKLKPSLTNFEKMRHKNFICQFTAVPYKYGYLTVGKDFIPLFNQDYSIYKYNKGTLVGPVPGGQATYVLNGKKQISYRHEGNFSYAFDKNVVYKISPPDLFPQYLKNQPFDPLTNINDYAANRVNFTRQNQYSASSKRPNLSRNIEIVKPGYDIKISLPHEERESGLAAILIENTQSGLTEACFYGRNNHTRYSPDNITPGEYNLIVLYNNGSYYRADKITLSYSIKACFNFHNASLNTADSASQYWLDKHLWEKTYTIAEIPEEIDTQRKDQKLYWYTSSDGNVTGRVFDAETGEPLPGVSIIVEGTSHGAISDIDGYFNLNIDSYSATILVSFIGYISEEIQVTIGSDIEVHLLYDIQSLDEVVVIGYGTQKKSLVTGAITSFSRITVTPEEENLAEADSEAEIKADQELYNQLLQLNSIRSNFSDVGFWKPKLYTDKTGKSNFSITFPDDITRWDATVYAMNRYLQTGTARKTIKSYKPIMAELKTPRFLTIGDTANAVGKVLNYTADSLITGEIKWEMDSDTTTVPVNFNDAHIELVPIIPVNNDSVGVTFAFKRNDGFFDGEKRIIPLVEQGTVRANGTLEVLRSNDSRTIKASENEIVTVEFNDNHLSILKNEVRNLLNYRFACNEQLASKLSGLITHKLICEVEGEEFKYDNHVNKIITRLLKNQNEEYLWGWWNRSPNTSHWMSSHILRSLRFAKDNGYEVPLDINHLEYKAAHNFDLAETFNTNRIELLHALATWHAHLDYKKYVHTFDSLLYIKDTAQSSSYYPRSYLYEKFLLQEVRQLSGLGIQRDSILNYKKEGMLGSVFFTDNKTQNRWYRNNLTTNIVAYRIAKNDSILKQLIPSMQLFFLESRQRHFWNTYQASSIVCTVIPDLIEQGFRKDEKTSFKLSGTINQTINEFPYKISLKPGESLNVSSLQGLPMYFMQYSHERVTKASSGVDGFEIRSSFSNGSSFLNAGVPVTLTVEVNVTKDANGQHVMLDIPIPASCSYANKNTAYSRNESYREYHKDRTYIFCEKLNMGMHQFKIQLIPRFTGTYHLNPAQVSLMYFPVINANTDMKIVEVTEKE